MSLRAPTTVLLRRAQLVLVLAGLVPTALLTPIGVVLLVLGRGPVTLVAGVLVLAFCASAVSGYVLGSIFIGRGASLARVQNDFLSMVSHELRTPLTSIRMFVDTLRAGRVSTPAETERCLDVLDTETRRLDGLVGEILDLLRMQSNRRLFAHSPVKIEEIVASTLDDLATVCAAEEAAVDLDLEPGLVVRGDAQALSRALGNLLTNAWKYAGGAGSKRVAIVARAVGRRRVALSVVDRGPGIAARERKRIFDAFERGTAAETSGRSGIGLGLAIVRAVARAHRGTVEIESQPGEGAVFRLVLPRAQAAA